MDAETSPAQIASVAQSKALWGLFVGSGFADQTDVALLRCANKHLKPGMKAGQRDVRQRRIQGASRIRGYLAKQAQPV